MLKFPIATPLDPKEAAIIERRRKYEEERRCRIFNARERLYGIDKHMLEEQIAQRKAEQHAERHNQLSYENNMLQHSKIALLCEKNKQEEKRRLLQEINDFRAVCQRPQDRTTYDLNCSNRLQNDGTGETSFQRFEGEDLTNKKRSELQRKQQKAWLDQQIKEKEAAEAAQKYEEMSQQNTALELDKKAMELERAEQEVRRLNQEALAEFNKALLAEQEAFHQERERLELLDNQVEMTNCITGDFLTENPEIATSAFGPHRLIPDRWKGMSPEQRERIRKEQLQQALEEKKRREDEKRRNREWESCMKEMDQFAILVERDMMRRKREENKELLNQNKELSQEQKLRNEYLNKCVYSNAPTEAYFQQFNTSSR